MYGGRSASVQRGKNKAAAELLGLIDYDSESGWSAGVLAEVELPAKTALGAEVMYNFGSQSFEVRGVGFKNGSTSIANSASSGMPHVDSHSVGSIDYGAVVEPEGGGTFDIGGFVGMSKGWAAGIGGYIKINLAGSCPQYN